MAPQLHRKSELHPHSATSRSKADIINALGKIHGWDKYLEFCTSSTGLHYSKIDRRRFLTCERFMYRCAEDYDDGMTVDFRCTGLEIGTGLQHFKASGKKYNVILVDPWHEYKESLRDLTVAFDLLDDGGMLVVHDCFPKDKALVSPTFQAGSWCGVTYKAFIDFSLSRPLELDFYTVDADFGCGIVRKMSRPATISRKAFEILRSFADKLGLDEAKRQSQTLEAEWHKVRTDDARRFSFFLKNAGALLKLKTYDEFVALEQNRSRNVSATT